METERVDPRRQLEEYGEAVQVSRTHGWRPAPRWLFPLLALAGPATVAWSVSSATAVGRPTTSLRVASIALWALVLTAVLIAGLRERSTASVRTKPPVSGGRTSAWMFLLPFSIIVGLMLTGSLAKELDPWPLAAASYLWLLIVPWVSWVRHVRVLTQA